MSEAHCTINSKQPYNLHGHCHLFFKHYYRCEIQTDVDEATLPNLSKGWTPFGAKHNQVHCFDLSSNSGLDTLLMRYPVMKDLDIMHLW